MEDHARIYSNQYDMMPQLTQPEITSKEFRHTMLNMKRSRGLLMEAYIETIEL